MHIISIILGTICGIALYEYLNDRRTCFSSLFNEAGRVSKTLFPKAGVKEHMLKLKQEADEVIANPYSLEEHSDCLLVVLSSAYKAGITPEDLLKSSRRKLKLLERRVWKLEEDGTYQHLYEEKEKKKNFLAS
jgi:hypothetical protein